MATKYYQNKAIYSIQVPSSSDATVTIPAQQYVTDPTGLYYAALDSALTQVASIPGGGVNAYTYVPAPGFKFGAGAPVNGSMPDGSFYMRTDSPGALTYIYVAAAGVWSGIV